jgi:polyisoprenoid-binding protein YceI
MKSFMVSCISLLLLCNVPGFSQTGNLYFTNTGYVDFTSDAPLEIIKASSDKLTGILDLNDRSFRFSVPMTSFQGFNSAMQRTHFNENYLESDKFPNSTFNGKVIEEVDFTQPGNIRIRAKGQFTIHGITQDRIIQCNVKAGPNSIEVNANFTVPLKDHDITIPSIVQQKIAEIIVVNIQFTLKPMN